jgi:hypothetical protein
MVEFFVQEYKRKFRQDLSDNQHFNSVITRARFEDLNMDCFQMHGACGEAAGGLKSCIT